VYREGRPWCRHRIEKVELLAGVFQARSAIASIGGVSKPSPKGRIGTVTGVREQRRVTRGLRALLVQVGLFGELTTASSGRCRHTTDSGELGGGSLLFRPRSGYRLAKRGVWLRGGRHGIGVVGCRHTSRHETAKAVAG